MKISGSKLGFWVFWGGGVALLGSVNRCGKLRDEWKWNPGDIERTSGDTQHLPGCGG